MTTTLEKTIRTIWASGALRDLGDQSIQGGKISAHGNLYVSVGGPGHAFGIFMIDPVDGYVQTWYPIDPGAANEFEGIDVVDLDADTRAGGGGQIHLQECNVTKGTQSGFSSDDLWFAHYRVDDPSKL